VLVNAFGLQSAVLGQVPLVRAVPPSPTPVIAGSSGLMTVERGGLGLPRVPDAPSSRLVPTRFAPKSVSAPAGTPSLSPALSATNDPVASDDAVSPITMATF
jgi:hypothetical protein